MNFNRRGLLIGLGSLLAAPAIVHAGNLMPVSSRMLYDRRFLIDYMIGTDTFAMRADVAQFKLPRPGRSSDCTELTEKQAKQLFPGCEWNKLKPGPHEQLHVEYLLEPDDLRKIAMREFDGTILAFNHPIIPTGRDFWDWFDHELSRDLKNRIDYAPSKPDCADAVERVWCETHPDGEIAASRR